MLYANFCRVVSCEKALVNQKRSRGIIQRSAKLNGNLIGAIMNSNSSYLKTNQIKKANMDKSFRKFDRFLKRHPSLPVAATKFKMNNNNI